MNLIQYFSLAIFTLLSLFTIFGLFKASAFNFIGKFNKFEHDVSLKIFNIRASNVYENDHLWFVPWKKSRIDFTLITILNIVFILLFLLLALGIIYFK